MTFEVPDDDVDLIIRALEHYYAYTVAKKGDDARYRDLAERLKRKPPERVAAVETRRVTGTKRKS